MSNQNAGGALLFLLSFLSLFAGTSPVFGQLRVLHSFRSSGVNQQVFNGGLVFDRAGNLYGTSSNGDSKHCGTVFQLAPKEGGGWAYKTLHTFLCNDPGGSSPNAPLILDAAGKLYGTTAYGGAHNDGTIFEMIPAVGGTWTEKVLYSFLGPVPDGVFPFGSLVFDSSGSLYGTTLAGGSTLCGGNGCGTVFELIRHPGGAWQEKMLHRFTGGNDGINPAAGLVFDSSGNLYGTTSHGGDCANNCGTVFRLTPSGDTWTEAVLHKFNAVRLDGDSPYSNLIFDAAGNLYGTTFLGGQLDEGTVFRLTPQPDGSWKENVIHDFGIDNASYPYGGLILDSAGSLYGTSYWGGDTGPGTIFELSHQADDTWAATLLHTFDGADGGNPYAGVVFDAAGNLFGTTSFDGTFGGGTVFELRH